MKINRKELLNILDEIKSGADTKNVVGSLGYYLFTGKDIITYNDKISIQHPLKTDFNLLVKANDFYKIISKIKDDTISLGENDGKLGISCKSAKIILASIYDEELNDRIKHITKSLNSTKWEELPGNFIESVLVCSFTASTQESDGTLTCVYVNENTCVASDNNRISFADLDKDIDEMFIKASEIKTLVSILPTSYAITESWLHFKGDNGCIFSIRRTDGQFPDFLPFFDFEGIAIDLPSSLTDGIDLTSVLMDADDPSMNFKISNNVVILSIKNENGKSMHRSKIKYSGADIDFAVNPEFLKEMMKHSSSLILGKDKAKLKTENFSLLTALYG